MLSEIVFFVLAVLVAVSTALAVTAPRRPAFVGFVAWLVGLVTNELPFVAIAWSVILVGVFGALGVFGSPLGVAGAVLLGLALLGQTAARAPGGEDRCCRARRPRTSRSAPPTDPRGRATGCRSDRCC